MWTNTPSGCTLWDQINTFHSNSSVLRCNQATFFALLLRSKHASHALPKPARQ